MKNLDSAWCDGREGEGLGEAWMKHASPDPSIEHASPDPYSMRGGVRRGPSLAGDRGEACHPDIISVGQWGGGDGEWGTCRSCTAHGV